MVTTDASRGRKANQAQEVQVESKLQRFNLGLPQPAVEELGRIQELTGQSQGALMRWALVLLARYVRAMEHGEEVRIVNPKDPSVQRILELPIDVRQDTTAR